MKILAWGIGMALGTAGSWAQSAEKTVTVNRVKAVVGTTVITQFDVFEYRVSSWRRANEERRLRLPDSEELVLGEMIINALLMHEIRNRKGFVMPAGLGERLLASHLHRAKLSRSQKVRELQRDGITLEQFENDLIDRALLQVNLDPLWDSIQISPSLVKAYFSKNEREFDSGAHADILAFEIPASEEGIDKKSIEALVAGIKSEEEFKKIARARKVASDGERARVYYKIEQTHHVNLEVTSQLFISATKVGQATYYKSGEIFHVMFLKDRVKELKSELSDPVVQEKIKHILTVRQYNDRLNRKLQRLRQNINVYRPGGQK